MAVEQMRGCGYRKVGGLYLCGEGLTMACDRLPYALEICPVCGAGVKFTRGWTWLDWKSFAGTHRMIEHCSCPQNVCPVCVPGSQPQPYGLLWVGEQFYSPESFIEEAFTLGVSRRIAAIPRNLKLDETWVLLAHKKAIVNHEPAPSGTWTPEPDEAAEGSPGVFYAFRPQRLEFLVWESEATSEKLEELEKKGITPIIIPVYDVDHDPKTKLIPTDDERRRIESERDFTRMRDAVSSILS